MRVANKKINKKKLKKKLKIKKNKIKGINFVNQIDSCQQWSLEICYKHHCPLTPQLPG